MEYKWTALSVTTVGTFMSGMDTRLVVIGMTTVAQQLHAGPAEVVWINQSYLLGMTVGLLLIGRIGDLFGRIQVYNAGFAIFTVGSTLSALSLSPYQLLASRLLQGIGAGILVINSSAIITDASPRNELGTMLGINQTFFRIGNVAGLTLSGLILSVVDWRGLFYVNIPIGVFGTIWAQRRLREMAVKDPSKKMDWIGFVLFSVGLTLILVGITYLSYGLVGVNEGYASLTIGSGLLAVFVKYESGIPSPMLDLRLFRIRLFAAGNTAQLLNSLAWSGIILLSAFYLQIGLGYSPLQAGMAVVPLDGTYALSSFICGKLSDKHGTRGLTTAGLALNAFAFFALSTFGPTTPYLEFAMVITLIGIGNGMFTPPNLKAIMSAVPPTRIGIASGFRNTTFHAAATASYGLTIFFMTFGIPYATLSALIQNVGPQAVVSAARAQFFNGFSIAARLLALIVAIAILPSALRGTKEYSGSKKADMNAEAVSRRS